ncbi:4-hydroxy-tetrahydrodipicolinate reductase [Cuneatibacter sp. NSJ-177]|uniref:4-hydroxy-tetrahydrodipicolinate reductase n=1 Tax=Cuneatibacter sp. NSJ-177 TaxID=2931401 RepID=UPI001FD2A5AF|nr:4-hydroxy-tetrahydrodipicolinate reductase [Cuneatibacter sp. NSJ-177]MCJ7835437.1 4-hydroxy-tetrahydrodipicolinate reductase [Cuneatibacter sp. NSJ-177]
MVRAIMSGCNGAMGQVITQMAAEDPDIEIVAGIDINTEQRNGYPVFSSLSECTVKADVVIDFSSAKATDSLLAGMAEKKLPGVLCSTGLSEEQIQTVKKTSEQVAVLKSANMSVGVNLIFKLLETITPVLAKEGYDMEIVEKHHHRKVDAPSGTALAMADVMNASVGNAYHYKFDRTQERQKRDPMEIGIQSVRGGTIVGDHDVIFAGTDEVITISHTAYSRAIFGKGALAAAKFLAGKPAGFYDMRDVIG